MKETSKRLLLNIYTKYYRTIHSIVLYKHVPATEIEDVIHDTFISYYEHYAADLPDREIEALLCRIAYNKSNDYFRKSGCDISVSLNDEEYWKYMKFPESLEVGDALSELLLRDECQEAAYLIMEMREEWRIPYILYRIECRPMKEICSMLGLEPANARMRISRATQYMRDKMDKPKIVKNVLQRSPQSEL